MEMGKKGTFGKAILCLKFTHGVSFYLLRLIFGVREYLSFGRCFLS